MAGAFVPSGFAPAHGPDRVLGWDVLRGLCALAVALYHLLEAPLRRWGKKMLRRRKPAAAVLSA